MVSYFQLLVMCVQERVLFQLIGAGGKSLDHTSWDSHIPGIHSLGKGSVPLGNNSWLRKKKFDLLSG